MWNVVLETPPVPSDEAERLRSLRSLDILDTPPERAFDALTRLAAHLLRVPIALVSLVDAERQWFKSRYGLDAAETPRDISFCGHAVADQLPLIVENALADRRFADNPLVVGALHIRFYAGFPLKLQDGHVVGTLCAIDSAPRTLTGEERELLEMLTGQVVAQLELRRRNLQLAESERRLEALFNATPDAIVSCDERGRIERFNPAAEELFGFSPAELRGNNVKMLMPSPYREEHDGYIRAYLETGEARIIGRGREVTGQKKDGGTFPAELQVATFQEGGRPRFLGVVRDISERLRMQRMQGEFVSMVSHELRTPLTSIRGALGLVTAGVMGELPEEAKEFVDMAVANSERLSRLIDDILDLEKLSSGSMEFRQRVAALEPIVRETVAATAGIAAELQVELRLLPGCRDGSVFVDPARLVQVLTNLVSNAIRFSPDGAPVELSIARRGRFLRVAVRDYGPGVPEEFKARVFERFAQADSSSTRRGGGTGLGLSIARKLMQRMLGTIGLEDAEGGGARFYIELPAVAETPPQEGEHHPARGKEQSG